MSDEEIECLPIETVNSLIENVDEASSSENRKKQKALQRSRTLALWHDYSTILGAGYILMTVHVVYDQAFSSAQGNVWQRQGKNLMKIYRSSLKSQRFILFACQAALDQVATIADRIDCLLNLQQPIKSTRT